MQHFFVPKQLSRGDRCRRNSRFAPLAIHEFIIQDIRIIYRKIYNKLLLFLRFTINIGLLIGMSKTTTQTGAPSEKTAVPSADASQAAGNKKIAILFTDVKGSSAFYKSHGNIAGRIMIQKLNDMLFPIVRAYHGKVVKTIGDAIMAYFDSATDALWAAIGMQKRLSAHNREHDRDDEQLLIRVAVNYGYGLVEEKDVYGDVVNIAGKVINICEAQQILVTEAFYEKTKSIKSISFSPVDKGAGTEHLQSVPLYQINWEKAADKEDQSFLFVLALLIDKTDGVAVSRTDAHTFAPLIGQHADNVLREYNERIIAAFSSAETCLDCTYKIINTCLKAAGQGDALPAVSRIAVHAINKQVVQEQDILEIQAEADSALQCADPYDIVITQKGYQSLPAELRRQCTKIKAGAEGGLYVFLGAPAPDRPCILTPISTQAAAAHNVPLCFYCGSTDHPAQRCPSKHIRGQTTHIDTLCYMPAAQIKRIFAEHCADVTSPLQNVSEENRFDVLFDEKKKDPYSLCFFSFYEITQPFQLRSLDMLYENKTRREAIRARRQGPMLMGEDCLRVGRLSEAGTWFDKALKEQPQDHTIYIMLGLVCIEMEDPQKGISLFEKALSFSLPKLSEQCIRMWVARTYEIFGALPHAIKEVDKVLALAPQWSEAIYYKGILEVKSGNLNRALPIFKKLLRQSPRWYLMLALNPHLHSARAPLAALLNKELFSIRSGAEKSITSLSAAVAKYSGWFGSADEDFNHARELQKKAMALRETGSIAGLMDIPAYELNAQQLINRALTARTLNLQKKISAFKKHVHIYNDYLSRFPYPSFLSKKDFRLRDTFSKSLKNAQQHADRQPPPSPEEAKKLISALEHESAVLTANRYRLDMIKKLLFACECTGKSCVAFLVSALITASCFSGILLLYQGYEYSLSSITAEKFFDITQFGAVAGSFFGIIGAIMWLAKSYNTIHNKLEI